MKIGEKLYEWVFLHIRNGEQFAGLIEVPADLKNDGEFYKRCLASDLVQPKVEVKPSSADVALGNPRHEADRIIELRNPHQVIMQAGGGKQVLAVLPLNLGDKLIFLRAAEVLFLQFLDDKSPIVIEIRRSSAGIVAPGEAGEQRTAGGIIVSGAPQP